MTEATTDGPIEHHLMVFMFTDMVNSSTLKQKLGDLEYAGKIARPHNELFRATLARFAGATENNYTGDGFLATFQSVGDAVEMALLFHQALHAHEWPGGELQTRIGIHVGQAVLLDASSEKMLIASHAADMCARLMSLGQGRQTLLTRHAFDDARQYVRVHPPPPDGRAAPSLTWTAHGRYRFKGREDDDPIEVFEVGAAGFAPAKAPPDAEKARRVLNADEEATLGWRPAAEIEVPGKPGWLVTEKIGEGGFGEVWLVRQRKTGERRVFKFCFDPERLRSLKRELSIFRLIRESLGDRDDITRLHDVRLDEAPFYLESDYVPSGNLLQWSEGKGGIGKIPLDARLTMMTAICRAVAAAHSVGVIHKDIKPSNVLMREDAAGHASPVLADFGIGIVTDASQFEKLGITQAGFTMSLVEGNDSSRTGTRMYAPPESLTGKPPTVQTDVYALGVLLYQLAVGDLQRPLATGWEKGVADPILREDIAAATEGSMEDRLRDVSSLLDRLTTQAERRKKMQRARLLRKTAIGLAAAAVVVVVAILGKGTVQKGKVNRLNTQIQQRLESGSLSEKDVAETDRLVAELSQVSVENADGQRRRVADQLAKFATSAIHRANLSDADQRQIESWLALLQPRDAARAAQLRTALAGRMRQWEPAYEIKPPFKEAGDLGGQVSTGADAIAFSRTHVALPFQTQGAMRIEAVFASLTAGSKPAGFVFDDGSGHAYTFRVTPPAEAVRPAIPTKYTLDLDSPDLPGLLKAWNTPSPKNVSVSLESGRPVLRLERTPGDATPEVEAALYFNASPSVGKTWTTSWRSRVTGATTESGGGQFTVRYIGKDGKHVVVFDRAFIKNEDWGENSRTFPIPLEATSVRVGVRLYSKMIGLLETSELRIVERETADEIGDGIEIYAMPHSEWHPSSNGTEGWTRGGDTRRLNLLSENGKKFLRLGGDSAYGWGAAFTRTFPVDPSLVESITIKARVRAPFTVSVPGDQQWLWPRIRLRGTDSSGKQTVEQNLVVKEQGDWKMVMMKMKPVPPSSETVSFGPSIDSKTKGAIDVSDLTCELELKTPRPAGGKESQIRLEILREGKLLSESQMPADALAGGSVRIEAQRAGNLLRLQVGQQRPLEVFDPFPLAAPSFSPALLTAPGRQVRSLAIYRQSLPEKPQPLELGDTQFFAGNYAGAMAAYEAQLPTAGDAATRAQARLKIGLCLLPQNRAAEAEASFIEAAKADAPPWSGLASFQLLALYLKQKRVTEADVVMARLRASPDFAETVASLSSDLNAAIYKGYNSLGRAILESGSKEERQATTDRLDHLLEIADALHMPAPNQYLLRFEICRLYAVSGQTPRALDYCAEQLARMEKEEGTFGTLSGMFAEIHYNIMARDARYEHALPLLQKWDALGPNDFTAVHVARCLLAMKRFDEAEAKIAGVLSQFKPLNAQNKTTVNWLYASLVRGLIAEVRDGAEAGRAVWAAAFRELREAAPNHDPALCIGVNSRQVLIGFILLGGLGGEMKDEDMPSLRKAISATYAELDAGAGSAKQIVFKNASEQFSKEVCLSLCTGERGGAYAKSFIRGEMLFFEAYRMPFIFMLEEYFIQTSAGRGKLTAGQEALFWQASEAINDAIREKQISSPQMLGLLAAWKGITNVFGWEGAQAQLPPKVRGPLAYIMGQRYVKLGKPEDALGMFRTAKADAEQLQDAPLAALAGSEIKNLGGK